MLGIIGITPEVFENMTPREINVTYKGHQWTKERHLKDMAWMLANLGNICGPPAKNKRKLRPEDFARPNRDKANHKNPFYLDLMGI